MKGVVNVRLEGCRGIAKAEGHDQVLKVTIPSTEGCFVLVSFRNAYTIEGVSYIEPGEALCTLDSIHDFGSKRNRIAVFNSHSVQGPVVHTETQATIGFLDE